MKYRFLLICLTALITFTPLTVLAETKKVYTAEELDRGFLSLRENREKWGLTNYGISVEENSLVVYEEDKTFSAEKRAEIRRICGVDNIIFIFTGVPLTEHELSIRFEQKVLGYDGFQEATFTSFDNIETIPVTDGVSVLDEKGVTQVSLKALAKVFRGTLEWDGQGRKAILRVGEKTIEIYPAENYILLNGEKTEVSILRYQDRLYLPLRTAGALMEAKVSWSDAAATATMQWIEK